MTDVHWTAYLTAFTAPVVALLALYIAWAQWRTARDKLRLDLFEKRVRVYDAVINALNEFYREAKFSPEGFAEYQLGVSGAQWLFGEEVQAYLKEFRSKMWEFELHQAQLEGLDGGDGRLPHIAGKQSVRQWFVDQPDQIDELFMPYLEFRELVASRG